MSIDYKTVVFGHFQKARSAESGRVSGILLSRDAVQTKYYKKKNKKILFRSNFFEKSNLIHPLEKKNN